MNVARGHARVFWKCHFWVRELSAFLPLSSGSGAVRTRRGVGQSVCVSVCVCVCVTAGGSDGWCQGNADLPGIWPSLSNLRHHTHSRTHIHIHTHTHTHTNIHTHTQPTLKAGPVWCETDRDRHTTTNEQQSTEERAKQHSP